MIFVFVLEDEVTKGNKETNWFELLPFKEELEWKKMKNALLTPFEHVLRKCDLLMDKRSI